jgi:hypothetical protein
MANDDNNLDARNGLKVWKVAQHSIWFKRFKQFKPFKPLPSSSPASRGRKEVGA